MREVAKPEQVEALTIFAEAMLQTWTNLSCNWVVLRVTRYTPCSSWSNTAGRKQAELMGYCAQDVLHLRTNTHSLI